MQDSIDRITSLYNTFTQSEKKIADYFLSHMKDALTISIHEFSKCTGVSQATIIRFCRTLGYSGYREFCLKTAQGMSNEVEYISDLSAEDADLKKNVSRVLLASVGAIYSTLEELDFSALETAAKRIAESKNLLFVGMGTSHIVCKDAMMRFLRAGFISTCYDDSHASLVAAGNCKKGDVVIGISHSGTTSEVLRVLEVAKNKGAFVIGITTYPTEKIKNYCGLLIKTCTRESPSHKVAITSRTSQLAVIDALFIAVMTLSPDDAMKNIIRATDNILSLAPERRKNNVNA